MIRSTVFARRPGFCPGEEPADAIAGPQGRSGRLVTLDVLRGFALLGILTVNVESFAGPESLHDIPIGLAKPAFVGWHAHLDLAIVTLKWMFVEGKMRAMFAMLFGAGAVLLTSRLEQHVRPSGAADIFLRRNMWLMLFGLIHGCLIWDGDILLLYALTGLLFLFPLRNLGPRKLVGVGLVISIVGGTLGLMNFIKAVPTIRDGDRLAAAIHVVEAGQTPTQDQIAMLVKAEENKRKQPAAIMHAV